MRSIDLCIIIFLKLLQLKQAICVFLIHLLIFIPLQNIKKSDYAHRM